MRKLSADEQLGQIAKQTVFGDCWIWEGATGSGGYGKHAFVYSYFNGPIPEGKEIHHKCENRRCVCPDHLEAVTRSEHRKLHPPNTNGNETKTHCPAGHPYNEENTARYGSSNRRRCRVCERTRALARFHRLKGTT